MSPRPFPPLPDAAANTARAAVLETLRAAGEVGWLAERRLWERIWDRFPGLPAPAVDAALCSLEELRIVEHRTRGADRVRFFRLRRRRLAGEAHLPPKRPRRRPPHRLPRPILKMKGKAA